MTTTTIIKDLHTLVSALDHISPAQWTVAFVPILHLDHAANAEQVAAVQPDGQPADGET